MRQPHLIARDGAFIADNATVVGDVTLGADVSVWYGTVIRGDVCSISIGRGTNVQDLTVIHPMTGRPVVVGEDVTVGHAAVIHCTSIGDRSLIGIGAKVLTGSRVGSECIIAAGALVLEEAEIPDESVVMGTPGRVVRRVTEAEKAFFRHQAEKYVRLAKSHLPDAEPFDWRAEKGAGI